MSTKRFGKNEVVTVDWESISFSLYTKKELRAMCPTKIVTPITLDAMGHPVPGGLYDTRMGPMADKSEPCGTCRKNVYLCRGHFGYVELPLPVVNPMFFKNILQVLKISCLECYTVQFPVHVRHCLQLQMKLLKCGLTTEALEVGEKMSEAVHAMNKDHDDKKKKTKEKTDAASLKHLFKKFRPYEKLANETMVNLNGKSPTSRNKETVRNEILYDLLRNFTAHRNCISCKKPITKISVERNNKVIVRKLASPEEEKHEENVEDEDEEASKLRKVMSGGVKAYQEEYLTPDESRKYMRAIWEKDGDILRCLLPVLETVRTEEGESPVDCLYLEVVPVLPPMCRPASFVDDRMSDHPQTQAYKAVVQSAVLLGIMIKVVKNRQHKNGGIFSDLPADTKNLCEVMPGKTPTEKLNFAWENLQYSVNALMDKPPHYRSDGLGLKQIIEKKQGIIRMNMMGKRVNFSARSVITPDPYIRVDEVGIPEAFAKTLTYPTPVTHWNVEELRKVVVNGPDVYPGANLIELEDGTIRRINPADPIQREGIAKTLLTPCIKGTVGVKKVHRHMRNGDVVLLNRQPTLHRPSLMAHKVRILGGGEKVLRLHYANCKAYNADFDGDEMNVHFPQNEVARCEAYQLANVASHYVVPKDGTPLSGLIQDHVIAGVNLSMRGRFFTRPEYDQLVYQGLSFKIAPIKVLPPAILKPKKLWSGKQVLSTIILNLIAEGKAGIRLTSTSKIGAKEWEVEKPRQWLAGGTPFKDAQCMSETEVVIRNGELLCGVLDKAHYGSTPYGLVHCFYELYGGTAAVKLLSAFSRLFTAFMSTHIGFTLSVRDILVKAKANRKRRKVIEKLREKGAEACAKALGLPPDTPCDELAAAVRREGAADPQLRNLIDREYKLLVNPYTQKITKICMSGLVSKFPKNNLQLMIQSGAKGASVNAIQISCLLGQIELEGKRPPLMISGKSLPNFPVNDLSPRAGGFIDQRFMTGISPPEFFFHCMAGREGLIDTAVKTSRSGYLQRCLVKHLEGLHVGYDMTVRDSDGSVVQFLYGEDGMDTSKVQFLNKKQLPFLEENADIVVDEQVLEEFKTDDDKRAKKVKKHQKKISSWREKFGDPFAKNYEGAFGKLAGEISKKFPGKANPEVYREAWAQVDDEIKNKLRAECPKCPDPVTSIYRPDHHFGSLSEHQADLLDDYCRAKSKKQRRTVENMYKLKSSQSLCSPGEPVGLLAAQSVGEPSTQMTLNTFHFAGRGEMNVTLGIPRLREILMMASKNIKTPSMEIPFKEDVPNLEMEAETLKKTLTRVVLCEVLHKIEVTILQEIRPVRQHKYTLEFHFLPHDLYEDRFKVKPKAVIKHVSKKFFGEMFAAIRKFAKGQKVSGIMMEETKKNARSNRNKDDEDEEDEEGGADDETATSSSKNKSTSKNNMAAASDDDTSEDEEGEEDEEDARFRNRHEERTKEQEPDDEEEIEMADQDGDDYASDLEIGEDGYELNSSKNGKKASSREEEEDRNEEENTVLNSYSYIKEYTYDKKGYLWCKVVFALPITIPRLTLTGMLCKVATSSVIWEVPKINKAITYKKDGRLMLRTDGVNILEMCKYSRLLDLNKLHCNDIYHVSQTYGIEAARRVIVKEVQDVFAVYGIEVDPRHLLLVADYMCFNGTYEPLSRKCMEGGASPFQQMSFESHLSFLKSAVVGGKRDDLTNPSSGLIAGKPVEIGTNLCDVMIDIEKIVRQNRK